jgi:hypothetical protein
MKNNITYEWDFETRDLYGAIEDHNFRDTLSEFHEYDKTKYLVLVRNEGNEREGLTDRFWAYVKNKHLPEYFQDAANEEVKIKVPAKFHNELKKYFKI